MTASPTADLRTPEPPEEGRLLESDLAMMLAAQIWGCLGQAIGAATDRQDEPVERTQDLWRRLEPSWLRRLGNPWDHFGALAGDRARALERLRRMHEASIRVDLRQVHPSWCVRALAQESPSVRRVVARYAPTHLREPIRIGLGLDADDLAGERPADPEVSSWAQQLWTERLVGGAPPRPDDALAIAVLSRLSLRAGYAVCRLAGDIKCRLAGRVLAESSAGKLRGARIIAIQNALGSADAAFREQAVRDLESRTLARVRARHLPARLGAQTLARLLADCEPFRVRWALQHWPYGIAKVIRALMPAPAQLSAALSEGETLVLKTAWDRLNLEGRLPQR
jgi:hypothetical protein